MVEETAAYLERAGRTEAKALESLRSLTYATKACGARADAIGVLAAACTASLKEGGGR